MIVSKAKERDEGDGNEMEGKVREREDDRVLDLRSREDERGEMSST